MTRSDTQSRRDSRTVSLAHQNKKVKVTKTETRTDEQDKSETMNEMKSAMI